MFAALRALPRASTSSLGRASLSTTPAVLAPPTSLWDLLNQGSPTFTPSNASSAFYPPPKITPLSGSQYERRSSPSSSTGSSSAATTPLAPGEARFDRPSDLYPSSLAFYTPGLNASPFQPLPSDTLSSSSSATSAASADAYRRWALNAETFEQTRATKPGNPYTGRTIVFRPGSVGMSYRRFAGIVARNKIRQELMMYGHRVARHEPNTQKRYRQSRERHMRRFAVAMQKNVLIVRHLLRRQQSPLK